jgi:hypothetical protein
MGGDVSRTVVNLARYAGNDSFGAGSIHKLITIGTPHLGSPLAVDLLQGNYCMRGWLADHQNVSVYTAVVAGSNVSGAVGDLQPGSPALQALSSGPGPTVQTALIAGLANGANFGSLDNDPVAMFIRGRCSSDAGAPGQPALAPSLTTLGWSTVFASYSGSLNDAIVPLWSELAGLANFAGIGSVTYPNEVPGVMHTSAIEPMGFTGPGETDGNAWGIQVLVMKYLNEPSTVSTDFFPFY